MMILCIHTQGVERIVAQTKPITWAPEFFTQDLKVLLAPTVGLTTTGSVTEPAVCAL